jgi:3-oxoacyl-[acyl-carrier protein] reductase
MLNVAKDFEGQAGIITGAASGIGKSTATHLARRGAAVMLGDIDEEGARAAADEICSAGGAAYAVSLDVAEEASVDAMVGESLARLGRLDFLVNNAGIIRAAPFLELEPAMWDQLVSVNLRGPYLCCRAVLPQMIKRGKGAIVNVSSMAGRSVSNFGGAHYTASKAGLLGLTRHLAKEFGPLGIRVNALCPGFTLTPFVTVANDMEAFSQAAARVPLARYAKPEEQAHVVAFLLSDASSFIAGAAIDANGGAVMM